MCLLGAILMLMKADTVSTSSASQQQTLTRPVLLHSRFLRQKPVSFTSTKIINEQREVAHTNPIQHLQPASIITHHQLHDGKERQLNYLLLFSLTRACLT